MSEPDAEIVPTEVLKPKHSWKGKAALIRKTKLQYPELTNSEIARTVGCSTTNVNKTLQRFLGKHSNEELATYQEHAGDFFDAMSLRFLGSITESKLRKSSATSLVTGAAIMFDKAQLAKGKPTGINVTALVDVAKLIRQRRNSNGLAPHSDEISEE